ncbi:MAG: hypothetical protein CVU11_06610 [Bacteroidetes bacterium HGW-Bacteroidetes-6]|jgi:hypothetical protein|nr:MAG: hypothetical protein CVU11_06610 [Bacteroidetes bacterium HGW-Bacteroidetes-6]
MGKIRHIKLFFGAVLLMLFGSSAQSCSGTLCYVPTNSKIPVNNVRDLGSDTTRVQQDGNVQNADD